MVLLKINYYIQTLALFKAGYKIKKQLLLFNHQNKECKITYYTGC